MQKTSYDMRISDWSSDVCSSDLDQRGRNGAITHRADDAFDIRPVADDQIPVEPVTEQWRKPAIALRRFECVEAPVGQARNARPEIEPDEMHRCEHDVGNAASIDVQRGPIGVAVMAEEPIERMDGFRSYERRAGKERVSRCRSRWSADHSKTKKT